MQLSFFFFVKEDIAILDFPYNADGGAHPHVLHAAHFIPSFLLLPPALNLHLIPHEQLSYR
jgi:hypothetical protein